MKHVSTDQAPEPIGPYSQGVAVGDFLFTAGQIGMSPGGEISPDVGSQARRAIANLEAVIQSAGAGLDRVVKTTIFLTNLEDFAQVNTVYQEFFGDSRPARSTVEVSRLPKDAMVEIEAIVFLGEAG